MFETPTPSAPIKFTTSEEFQPLLKTACSANSDIAAYHKISSSEGGRPIDAVVLGHGPQRVSLIAGAHSDEHVGPETLRTLALNVIAQKARFKKLLETYQFVVIFDEGTEGTEGMGDGLRPTGKLSECTTEP